MSGPASSAVLSSCGLYRYSLTRRWAVGPTMLWIMLNPSTADAEVDDPTIRRCVGFAKREFCGAIEVVNLFALRATDPLALRAPGDIVGPDNDAAISGAVGRAALIVAGWGASVPKHSRRPGEVLMSIVHRPVFCLGVTSTGFPKHPLYVKGDAPLLGYGGHAEKAIGVAS